MKYIKFRLLFFIGGNQLMQDLWVTRSYPNGTTVKYNYNDSLSHLAYKVYSPDGREIARGVSFQVPPGRLETALRQMAGDSSSGI